MRFGQEESHALLHRQAERVLVVAFQSSPASRPTETIVRVEVELRDQIAPGMPELLG